MDKESLPDNISLYFLDILNYRGLSNQIAEDFHVHHQSPQLLLIKNGECILEQSHSGISLDEALTVLN